METLPPELVTQILHCLPPASLKTARLTCRCFNSMVPSPDFNLLASFIDPAVAVATIEAAASDLTRRPKSIWSPRCSVPEHLDIPESFVVALNIGLARRGLCLENGRLWSLGKSEEHGVREYEVRQALFRWVLYLSYTSETEADVAHMWVVSPKLYK